MWFTFALVIVIATIITLLPGYLFTRLLGGKRAFSLVLAAPISVFLFSVSGIVIYLLGLRGLMPLLIGVAILLILVFGIYIFLRKFFDRKWIIPSSIDMKDLMVVSILGIVVGSYVFYKGIADPNFFLQFDDNYSHIGWITHSVQTGIFSMFKVSVYEDLLPNKFLPFSDVGFYPYGFHSLVAVTTLLSHATVTMAENAVNFVFVALVFPFGIVALTNYMFGKRVVFSIIAPAACFANMAFPIRMLTIHGPFPNMVAFCCIPATTYLFIQTCDNFLNRKGQKHSKNRPLLNSVFLGIFVLLGMVCCHPNSAFFWAVLIFPYFIVKFIPQIVFRTTTNRKHTVKLLVFCEFVFIICCVGAWILILKSSFMKSIVQFVWGWDVDPLSSISYIATQAYIMVKPELVCAILFWIGLIHAFTKKTARWYGVSYLFVSLFFILGLMGNVDIKRFFIGFWYTDPERIAAMICITAVPFVILGGADCIQAISFIFRSIFCIFKEKLLDKKAFSDSFKTRQKERGLIIQGTAIVTSLVVVALLLSPWDLAALPLKERSRFRQSLVWMRESYDQTEKKTYSSGERAFIRKVRDIVGDQMVLNNPFDGSSLAYAIDGLNVYYKFKMGDSESPTSVTIRMHLNRVYYDEKVQEAVRSIGAHYFIRLVLTPDDQYPTMPKGIGLWSGLNIYDGAPGFEVVLAEGPYRLYRITAID